MSTSGWVNVDGDTTPFYTAITAQKGRYIAGMKVMMSIASHSSPYFFLLLDEDGPLQWFKERGT
jgi:hypothetical protein